jgi:hypothetical protein
VDQRARLMELLARMQRLSDERWHLLDQPCRAMEDKAWVGPSARSFDGRIHGSLGTLQAELKEAIALLRHKRWLYGPRLKYRRRSTGHN